MKADSFWKPFLISLIATPILFFLIVLLTGGGHGTYFPAKLLFPYSAVSALLTGKVTTPFIIFSLFQFPTYGLVLGIANKRNYFTITAIFLFLLHFVAVVLCFVIPNENF